MVKTIVKQIFAISLSILFLSACVSNSLPPSLERGESIAIQPPRLNSIDVTVDSKAEKAGKGVVLGAAGAIGGAALGGVSGAVLGMSCGPLAIICSPMAAAAGILVGGVAGGAMGAVYGGTGGITGYKAKRFNEITARLIDADTLALQLHDQLNESVSETWVIDSQSLNTLELNIKSLHFKQHAKEQVQLVFDSEMKVNVGGRTDRFRYKYVGSPRNIDDWLFDEGKRFQSEIDLAIENVTYAMVARLGSN